MKYYEILKKMKSDFTILIFHDIYWSTGMKKAWNKIITDPDINLSLDLYKMGIVFFNKDILEKQHVRLRLPYNFYRS